MTEIGETILAVDTSIGEGSISIWRGNVEIASQVGDSNEPPLSEMILEIIERLCRAGGLSLENLDCIAIALGPGSYTGIRVGISTALGISLAIGCKTIGIPTLTALSIECKDETCLSVLSIGGEEFAIQESEPNGKGDRNYSKATIVSFDGLRKSFPNRIYTDIKTAGVILEGTSGADLPAKVLVASDNISHLVATAALNRGLQQNEITPIYARDFGVGR